MISVLFVTGEPSFCLHAFLKEDKAKQRKARAYCRNKVFYGTKKERKAFLLRCTAVHRGLIRARDNSVDHYKLIQFIYHSKRIDQKTRNKFLDQVNECRHWTTCNNQYCN